MRGRANACSMTGKVLLTFAPILLARKAGGTSCVPPATPDAPPRGGSWRLARGDGLPVRGESLAPPTASLLNICASIVCPSALHRGLSAALQLIYADAQRATAARSNRSAWTVDYSRSKPVETRPEEPGRLNLLDARMGPGKHRLRMHLSQQAHQIRYRPLIECLHSLDEPLPKPLVRKRFT